MAITQISIGVENRVRQYTCLPTDAPSSYPTDCDKGSRMLIMNSGTGLVSGELMYDGVDWKYIHDKTTIEDMVEFKTIHPSGAKLDAFVIDLEDKMVKNVDVTIVDTDAVTLSVVNVPRDCKLTMDLHYGALADITFFTGITFNATLPTFATDKKYRFEFATRNGGTNWIGKCFEF